MMVQYLYNAYGTILLVRILMVVYWYNTCGEMLMVLNFWEIMVSLLNISHPHSLQVLLLIHSKYSSSFTQSASPHSL
jgi:formate/nitrite transporter FocA (FNT family)